MIDENLAAPCGLFCEACEHLNKCCDGCGNVDGKPFWTPQMKIEVCPLYDCCINNKSLEHCGHCEELPCDTFIEFYDPSLSPSEARKSVLERIRQLLIRKEQGTENWIKTKKS